MECFHHDLARDWVALTCRIFYLHSLSKLAIQITQDSPSPFPWKNLWFRGCRHCRPLPSSYPFLLRSIGPLVHWSIHVHSTGVVPQLNACFAVDSSSHPLHSWANCYGPPEIGGNRWCPWVAGVLVAYWWIDGFWWITVLVDHWLIIACLLQMFALHGKLSIVWASFYTINRGYKSKMRAILHQNPEISSRTNHSLLSWLGLNIAKVPCTVICSRPAPWPEATSQPDGGETWKPQKK